MEGRLITVANGITFFRLGLFVVFIGLLHQGYILLATTFFVISWALDAVDGWVARTFKQDSEIGSLFDKSADRIMLPFGALAALAYGAVPVSAVFIFMKDWIGVLLILRRDKSFQATDYGPLGKLVTLLEGITLVWLLLALPSAIYAVGLVAIIGTAVSIRQLYKANRVQSPT